MAHTAGTWVLTGGERDPAKPGVYPRWAIYSYFENDTRGMTGTGIVAGGSQSVAYISANDDDARLLATAHALLVALQKLVAEANAIAEMARPAIGNTNTECLMTRCAEAHAAIAEARCHD